MRVLVVNAGSSSLRLRTVEADDRVSWALDLPAWSEPTAAALREALAAAAPVDGVGHRVVHGGTRFREAVRIDATVEAELRELSVLAPLHQPPALAALELVRGLLPALPQVACFDTAFHATLPAAAATYAVPTEWRVRLGIRRYGFHGLSHAYAVRRAAELVGRPPSELRVVSCHLGAGASLAAVAAGICQDTTMGFTPLEGLAMATRSGSVDPGLVLWLIEAAGLSAAEVSDALEHRSGLLGLAGTSEMRAVVTGMERGEPAHRLAFDVYVHRLRAGVAAMAAALNGLDVLVFTGGVGENSVEVRSSTAQGLEFLGVRLDGPRNRAATPDCEISGAGSTCRTVVVGAGEHLEVARQVRETLRG